MSYQPVGDLFLTFPGQPQPCKRLPALSATIASRLGQPCDRKSFAPIIISEGGAVMNLAPDTSSLYRFPTLAGHTYQIIAQPASAATPTPTPTPKHS